MRRWFLLLTLAGFTPPAKAGENEAEKLFRQVEKNLKAARSVQVRFDMKSGENKVQGTLLLGEGDRMRMDGEVAFGSGRLTSPTRIGDGTKIYRVARVPRPFIADNTNTIDSPKGLGNSLRGMLP